MSTMVPQPNMGWEVISQTPDQDFPPTGGIVNGIRVGFRTTSGILDSVFIPNTQYGDTAAIAALIAAKATQHAAVAQLKG